MPSTSKINLNGENERGCRLCYFPPNNISMFDFIDRLIIIRLRKRMNKIKHTN